MFNKKSIKKMPAFFASILFLLWIGGNLGLYIYLRHLISPELEARMNYLPEKLRLSESYADAESLYLMRVALKFPFRKEDIRSASPFFSEHQIGAIMVTLANNRKFAGSITFEELKGPLKEDGKSIINIILDRILFGKDDASSFESEKAIKYSRIEDFSWWNLFKNLRLTGRLIEKKTSISILGDFKVYDVETPYLKGILIDKKNEKSQSLIFSFEWNRKVYAVSCVSVDAKAVSMVREMLGTIRPVTDIYKSYKEIEALYKSNDTRYPKEVLLLSLMSLKDLTVAHLEDLLAIEKSKEPWNNLAINAIQGEIDFFRRK